MISKLSRYAATGFFKKKSVNINLNTAWTIGWFYEVSSKDLLRQYCDFQSRFKDWDQREFAKKWLLFPQNIGSHLSIDETSLFHGELYAILTHKVAEGCSGSIVAIEPA